MSELESLNEMKSWQGSDDLFKKWGDAKADPRLELNNYSSSIFIKAAEAETAS